jgi:hypothetical protein
MASGDELRALHRMLAAQNPANPLLMKKSQVPWEKAEDLPTACVKHQALQSQDTIALATMVLRIAENQMVVSRIVESQTMVLRIVENRTLVSRKKPAKLDHSMTHQTSAAPRVP